MPTTLPSFCKGLKLVRLGAILLLLQIAMSIVMTFKAFGADTMDESRNVLSWFEYVMLANGAATFAMCVGAARAIPELARARVDTRGVMFAAAGFAIATAAVAWSYFAITSFVEVALNPSSSLGDVMAASERLSSLKTIAAIKDIAYAAALVSLIRTVRRSAIVNDQLALRDEAGSMSRALVVMLVADVFYQLTYGLAGGGVGFLGAAGGLIIAGYWIFCHVRLVRFLANAAYFVNEPHDLPVATAIQVTPARDARPAPVVRSSTAPVARPNTAPSQPVAAPPPVVRPSTAPSQPVVAPPPIVRPRTAQSQPVAAPHPSQPVAAPPPLASPSQPVAAPPPRPATATGAEPSDSGDEAPSSEPRFLR